MFFWDDFSPSAAAQQSTGASRQGKRILIAIRNKGLGR